MAKNKRSSSPIVFSTDLDFIRRQAAQEEVSLPELAPQQQVLRLWLERGKGGKEATVIRGFVGSQEALEELARWLKNKCAVGGSAKNGEIILQGNHRDRVMVLLQERGYKNIKKAGG